MTLACLGLVWPMSWDGTNQTKVVCLPRAGERASSECKLRQQRIPCRSKFDTTRCNMTAINDLLAELDPEDPKRHTAADLLATVLSSARL